MICSNIIDTFNSFTSNTIKSIDTIDSIDSTVSIVTSDRIKQILKQLIQSIVLHQRYSWGY